ncbi:CAP domain-containing protein [Chelativorans sp. AA-79]|uniref:CAP domain-containing protein n=1 Tax=Chelativorans sp. AA-79 TaxID=3028735 RepID=UPI0023FA44DE|nr:CAP domain-containing protein [Chelativorans sp. AA-79]WEX09523.1 CAP domain-containing protein [Chelativorans sp. AA-79]
MTAKIRAAALVSIALLCAACASAPNENNALDNVAYPEALRSEALSLANQVRRVDGAPELRLDSTLNAAAQAHAEDMARRGFYGHRSPERRDVADRYKANGGGLWDIIGENISTCLNCAANAGQVRKFQEGWMRSPGHRRNILDARFDSFGFGIAQAAGKVYAVQTFVRPRDH